ncbi:MAG: MerR family transcriptional regulator [Candidatus Sericytochromatia bacterium]|nr:MerR family transcriptional regulator [Candidatus Sericytochromatia bacterium]
MKNQDVRTDWSTSEVAKELGVSPSLVRTWVAYMNWEVRRSAEGHRLFSVEDVDQLRALRSWLDAGNSLKEFRRERQGEGEYDPRLELRNALRRLREMHSQGDALIQKQTTLLESYVSAHHELQTRLEALGASVEAPPLSSNEAAKPDVEFDTSYVVQGVLKQLLSALLARQGKLQFLGRRETQGQHWLDYMGPGGRMQSVPDLCATEADRRLLDSVLQLIGQASKTADATQTTS